MFRASVLLLLLSCGMVLGCDTGSTAQNVSTTGWKGQKVGKSSNVAGPFRAQLPAPREISRTPAKTTAGRAQSNAEPRQRLGSC